MTAACTRTTGADRQPVARRTEESESESLALARLLDWRFLLPTLDLGTVLCGSGCSPDLVSALRGVAVTVATATTHAEWQATPSGSVDVVVMVDPSAADLGHAARVLRPGGSVCLQVHRSSRRRVGGVAGLAGAARALRRAGFVGSRAYWHAPSFATCARIIPLDEPVGVVHTLRRSDGVRFGRAKSAVGRALVRAGLFSYAVPQGSVVAHRPADGGVGRSAA